MAEERPASGGRVVSVRMIVAGIIAVLALFFVFQNTNHGRFHFLFWSFSMPAWIWIVLLFLAGVAVGSVFPWFQSKRRSTAR